MIATTITRIIYKVLPVVYLAFFLSIFCKFRVMSSSLTGTLLGLTILLAIFDKNHGVRKPFRNDFVWGCLLFYLLQLIALTYTVHMPWGVQQISVKITLFFIPVSLYFSHYLTRGFRDMLMPYYVLILSAVMLYCLSRAGISYHAHPDPGAFFYHQLVSPLGQHAVYFSIYVYVGFVYLLQRGRQNHRIGNRFSHLLLTGFFIFFIVLLASKLVIVFTVLTILIYTGLSARKSGTLRRSLIISAIVSATLLCILMVTHNPISVRFKDLFKGNINMVERNQFNPGDYFNGIQFRLLQWKLVAEILNEHHDWILGVSPGDAQNLLNEKYLALNMYTGERNETSHGYLGLNAHNQFLESVLETGIVGLAIFLFIFAGSIKLLIYDRDTEFRLTTALILLYCFVESVFQTQYGVLLFTFFPLFQFYGTADFSGKTASPVTS